MPFLYIQIHLSCGVATISRLLKIIGLFYKRALQKRPIFSKERYNFKEPTIHLSYGVATISRLLKIIPLFGEYRSLL